MNNRLDLQAEERAIRQELEDYKLALQTEKDILYYEKEELFEIYYLKHL